MLRLVDACTWVVFARYPLNVLISDRDIRQEIADGRIVLEPFDESMIQPASVDVRIDRFFRLFDNHKYPHIDPAQPQEDLTRLVGWLLMSRLFCIRVSLCWVLRMRR